MAFARPVHLSRDEVPAEEVEKERAKALERTKEEGKPEQAWDKIVDGRMTGWFKETVLLEQGLHGDKTTVAQSLETGSWSALTCWSSAETAWLRPPVSVSPSGRGSCSRSRARLLPVMIH